MNKRCKRSEDLIINRYICKISKNKEFLTIKNFRKGLGILLNVLSHRRTITNGRGSKRYFSHFISRQDSKISEKNKKQKISAMQMRDSSKPCSDDELPSESSSDSIPENPNNVDMITFGNAKNKSEEALTTDNQVEFGEIQYLDLQMPNPKYHQNPPKKINLRADPSINLHQDLPSKESPTEFANSQKRIQRIKEQEKQSLKEESEKEELLKRFKESEREKEELKRHKEESEKEMQRLKEQSEKEKEEMQRLKEQSEKEMQRLKEQSEKEIQRLEEELKRFKESEKESEKEKELLKRLKEEKEETQRHNKEESEKEN